MARVKMKASDFYNKLSTLKEKGFRPTRDTVKDPDARIRLAKTEIHKSFCPITAVAYCEFGKYFDIEDYEKANKLLGLHHDVAEAIMEGADDVGSYKTRIKLKKALGLAQA